MNCTGMELFNIRRSRLISAQVVSVKTIKSGLEGLLNLLDNWADMSLHLPLAVALSVWVDGLCYKVYLCTEVRFNDQFSLQGHCLSTYLGLLGIFDLHL